MDLDRLGIKFKIFLAGKKFLDVFTLVSLKLDYLSHVLINDDGAIASEFLLDDFENLLSIELLWESLNRC